jgi:ribonuclease Z
MEKLGKRVPTCTLSYPFLQIFFIISQLNIVMKPTFHHRLVNRQYEDPCLYVRMIRERRAFLFDVGNIERLNPGDIQKITDVFVTHMHIDHFIGFDTLLRALLRRETPIRLYGPATIIDCVEGKLRGYTWDLIEEYPLQMEVFGIREQEITQASFHAVNGFRRAPGETKPFDGIVKRAPSFCVRGSILHHGTPCLGYSLEEEFHINIDKAALKALGLPVGPWLSGLKRMIRENRDMDTLVHAGEREFLLSELLQIVKISKGQKVSYISDISPVEGNIRKAIDIAKDSDTLYCEAYFLHEDIGRAEERNHLTAKITGEVARRARVKQLVITHISPRYRDMPGIVEKEAMDEFAS